MPVGKRSRRPGSPGRRPMMVNVILALFVVVVVVNVVVLIWGAIRGRGP
ncbi:MAG: hypothetical protein ACRDVM_06145 [Acidimicrobiia bacterium]